MGDAARTTDFADAAAPLPEAGKSVAELIAATGGGINAIFDFHHKVFALPGARFAIDRRARATMFYIHLGNLHVSLTPMVLRREFNIATLSHDSQLIELASHALHHVKEIRPGDSVPKELVDGTASWCVEERHRLMAKAKLLVKILDGFAAEDRAVSVESVLGMTEMDLASDAEFQRAFAAMAESIGIDRNHCQEILSRTDAIARELCYIEALRDYAGKFRLIQEKVSQLAHLAKGDPAISEEVGRVLILLKPALAEFGNRFTPVDALTNDVAALLRNPWGQIRAIRDARDRIHSSLLPWADVLTSWDDQEVAMSHIMDENIHALYALLAANYAPSRIWR